MSQEKLEFGLDYRITERQRRLLRIVNDAVDAMGLIVAAGACGTRTQDLSDVLAGRANRYLRTEWLIAIQEASLPDFKLQLSQASVATGLTAGSGRQLTKDEENILLRAKLAAIGNSIGVGDKLIDEALGVGR